MIHFAWLLAALSLPFSARAGVSSRLQNNAAVDKFKNGDIEGTEEIIKRAIESDAGDSVILYNWATTNLFSVLEQLKKNQQKAPSDDQKKKLLAAHTEFSKLLKSTTPGGSPQKKDLYYQNGIAQDLLGNPQEALKNYYLSLAEPRPGLSDAEIKKLNEQTQKNIARLLAKPESSESGQGEGDGGGGNGSDPSKDSEGKNSGKPDPNGKEDKKREPEFTGTDVNEAQAQQILNSVSNQDRQVQRNKGQQQSKKNMQDGEEGEVSPSESDRPW